MNKTANYQLSQWDAQDKVQRTDFNADNAKIDEALGEHAAALAECAAAMPKMGNCVVCVGSYTGTGSAQTVTFPHKPVFICVQRVGIDASIMFAVQGCTQAILHQPSYGETTSLSWSGNSVTWSSQTLSNSYNSFRYIALLDAEN